MIRLAKFIDRFFGPVLIFFLSMFKAKKIPINPKRILIVKLWALGDSVLSLVLIDALKKRYPKARVEVLARKRNRVIYENDVPLIPLNLKTLLSKKYDIVFDTEPYLNISAIISFVLGRAVIGFDHGYRRKLYTLKTRFRKDQHMVQNYLDMARKLGIEYDTDSLVPISSNPKDIDNVQRFLKDHKINKIAGLTIGAAETATVMRMWPLERFARLADYLYEKGFSIFIIGGEAERDIYSRFKSLMQNMSFFSSDHFTLPESIYLIKRCSIFISNDTGPMHIAAAQSVPTIGLFGPNTPVLWGPYGKNNISIYKKHHLSPCIDNTTGKIDKKALNVDFMSSIEFEDVKKAVDRLI